MWWVCEHMNVHSHVHVYVHMICRVLYSPWDSCAHYIKVSFICGHMGPIGLPVALDTVYGANHFYSKEKTNHLTKGPSSQWSLGLVNVFEEEGREEEKNSKESQN